MSKFLTLALVVACLGASLTASAATINELDLTELSFEIDSFADNPNVSGTSNGIAFAFSAVSAFYEPFSSLSSEQYYDDLNDFFDNMHTGASFTVTFAEPIRALLVALANDNDTGDGPDFGLTPVDQVDITIGGSTGTKLVIADTEGALAYFEFANPRTVITHTDDSLSDGWDLSFFAYPVPLPPSLLLFLPALLSLLRLRRGALPAG
ncbi:MAG: hypothetical protein ACU84Q_15680 [Gammaproteobacteria bacterium]